VAAGVVGFGAFVASLILDWLKVDLRIDDSGGIGGTAELFRSIEVQVGPALAHYAVVYELGIMALLGLLASVVLRPDLAARLRLAAVALGIGVGGVVAGMTFELGGRRDSVMSSVEILVHRAGFLPGLYCAAGAVVALVAGVFLAAAPGSTPAPVTPVRPSRAGQAPIVAFIAGIAGAGAFVASMIFAWQEVSDGDLVAGPVPRTEGPLSISNSTSGLAYLIGTLALLGLLGAVVARPSIAAQLRPAATGVALGTLAVIVASVVEMREWIATTFYELGGLFLLNEVQGRVAELTYAHRPGVYAAFTAVVVLFAGVWVAASPAAAAPGAAPSAVETSAAAPTQAAPPTQATPTQATRTPATPPQVAPAQTAPAPAAPAPIAPSVPAEPPAQGSVSGPAASWLGPVGYVDGLTVTASEPIDMGSQGDILRS